LVNSLPDLVAEACREHASRPFIYRRDGDRLASTSYGEAGAQIEAVARGLVAAGVEPGDRVVLLSENRWEWSLADCAILRAGAVTVPIYPSLPSEQVTPLIERVAAKLVIVEDRQQLAKLAVDVRPDCVQRILAIEMAKIDESDPMVAPFTELETRGADGTAEAEVARRVEALDESSLATIIFTSGTTGVPKGAMLTHGNLLSNVLAAQARIKLTSDERFLTFLPLSHVFMRMVAFLGIHAGVGALYNDSLRMLLPNLKLVRPTVLIVVPRFLEMMREKVQEGIAAKEGLSGTIARWAMEVAEQVGKAKGEGRPLTGWVKFQQKLAEKRVFSAIREQLGLDAIRFMVSGGAALPPDVGRWFYGLGVPICQGYGLTETSPAVAINSPYGEYRFHTIGEPLPEYEVKIAEDGELLCRGAHIMAGYWEMPAETAEAIDSEGWFHTGDIASFTDEGHLQITDRKKNIMVLANGKNVAPAPIENRLSESPLISQILLIGDNQNVVTALIVPQFELLKQALAQAGEAIEDAAGIAASKTAEKLVRAEIDRLSGDLAAFEKPRKFRLLAEPFSMDKGEVTPTMKLRRKQILDNYAAVVSELAE